MPRWFGVKKAYLGEVRPELKERIEGASEIKGANEEHRRHRRD